MPPDECVLENHFSYFSTKTYAMGTQKNHLIEMVLLNTQYTCLTLYSINTFGHHEILWKMEHLLFWSKCSNFHSIFKSIQQNLNKLFLIFFFNVI